MTKLILIAVLFFTANVAGAENYTCSNGKTTFYITEEDLKEQPSSKTEHCKELTFKGTLKCDGVTMDMSEKSDAEKWREKCEEYLEKSGFFKDFNNEEITLKSHYANIATAYCTRAVLEEIRKELGR